MSEKGGKGFSLPTTTPKSSIKAKDGNGDGAAKSKRGRKVQFDSQGSPEPAFNFSSSKSDGRGFSLPSSKSDGKAGNRGKTPVAKEAQPLELKVEKELPENAKCLMDCEAANILQGIQGQMVLLSADPSIKLPESFDRGLQYAETHSKYTDPPSVRRVLETLTKHGVSNSEICVIANVCPESMDEVFALVPSLKGKRSKLSEPLKEALDELAKLKK
ncbi:hypothetical protein SLE2022_368320 [Rubroshorea leprosula]